MLVDALVKSVQKVNQISGEKREVHTNTKLTRNISADDINTQYSVIK